VVGEHDHPRSSGRDSRSEQPHMKKIFVEPGHGDLRGVVPEKAAG
jgi:hypothetical protein